MPARTVIFDSITKFDGKSSRNLESAEYTQMVRFLTIFLNLMHVLIKYLLIYIN